MSWTETAKETVKSKGFHDKDSDYDGMIGKALDRLIDVHGAEGHSGMSHYWVADLFHALCKNDGYLTVEDKEEAFKKFGEVV